MVRPVDHIPDFKDFTRRAARGECAFCEAPLRMEDFRDDQSLREAKISGLCQSCQDQTFE